MTATRPMGAPFLVERLPPAQRRAVERGAAVIGGALAVGSVAQAHWRHGEPLYLGGDWIPAFDWIVPWFGQIGVTGLLVALAAVTGIVRRPQEVLIRLTAAFAVAVAALQYGSVRWWVEASANGYESVGLGPGPWWLIAASVVLLVPHLRRPTFRWLRPWLDRWR